jgi:hypothetical protein
VKKIKFHYEIPVEFEYPKKKYIEKSLKFGNDTGNSSFNERIKERIVKIYVWSGEFVDAIQVEYQDQKDKKYGGNGGEKHKFKLKEGEYIKKVEVRSGSWIDSIKFITNTGRESKQFGGNGGSLTTVDCKNGLLHIDGSYSQFVVNLQFLFKTK